MPALSVRTLMSKTATGQSVAACDLCETRRYAGCEWTLKSESECTLTKARIESHANWTATRVVECYRDTLNGAANMCDENLCSTHENTKNKKLYNRTARRTVSVKFCQRLTEWTNCIRNQKQNQSNRPTVKTTLRRTCMRVQPRRVDCRNCGQQAWPSTTFADNTIDLQAKFSAFRVWDKKCTLLLKIPEFPYNTVYDRWKEASMLKPVRTVQPFSRTPTCDRQTDRDSHRHRAVAYIALV